MKKKYIILGIIILFILAIIIFKPAEKQDTFIIKKTDYQEKILVSGVIESKNVLSISAQISGKIDKLNKDIGDSVKKDDVILTFDSSQIKFQIEQKKADLNANFNVSENDYIKYKKLYEEKIISNSEFRQKESAYLLDKNNIFAIENMKAELEKYTIKSPVDGIITNKFITENESVNPATPLFEISSSEEKILTINIDEKFASSVFKGQKVEMFFPNNKNISSTGKIYYISPYVDKNNNTIEIKATIDNPREEFLYNINLTAILYGEIIPNSIVVPEKYIVPKEDKNYVYIINNKKIELREVEISNTYFKEVLIKSGLQENEEIIFPTDKIKKDVGFTHYG